VSLSLKITDLGAQPQTSQGSLSTAWCAERMAGVYRALDATMPVEIKASRAAEVIEANVHETGRFEFDCSRCAEPAELLLDVAFQHHFVAPGHLDAGDPDDLDAELEADPDVSEHDGVHIALEPLCIEHAILELPDFPVCSEDCRGLCPVCGTNLNQTSCLCRRDDAVKSTWAVLKEIKLEPKV
jgi:uncharacterized protein